MANGHAGSVQGICGGGRPDAEDRAQLFSAGSDIHVPVTIVQSEHDEFIKREHAEYLANAIPDAEFIFLDNVSHFAPLQRPEQFNTAILEFAGKVLSREGA